MADEKDQATLDAEAKAKAGEKADDKPKTYTEADLQKEADRRVTEAQKKWKSEQESILADKTKDAETRIADLAKKAEEAERKADFVTAATAAGIRNVNAAYIVAAAQGHIDGKGRFSVDSFKKDNPEFFAPAANANAGAGAGSPQTKVDMDAWLRSK